jgi:mannose-P-dolichol utilization defect 1
MGPCFAAAPLLRHLGGRTQSVAVQVGGRAALSPRRRPAAAAAAATVLVAGAVPAAPAAPPPASALGLLSTGVGSLVLLGSIFYKLPQVLRIARRRSGKGISVVMYSVETVATTFSALYFLRRAFHFSTYGELFFIILQNAVILSQIAAFENLDRVRTAAAAVLYAAAVAFLASPAAPLTLLMALQLAAIPLLNLARVPQIVLNWRRKSTGELSPVTLGLQVVGNVARIFTTLASVGDALMLLGVLVSTAFNTALVGQYIHYNTSSKDRSAGTRAT